MKMTLKTSTAGPGAVRVVKSVSDLSRMRVLVGVPEKNASRKKGRITNAQLAFLHTNGVRASDMRRIVQAKMNRGMTYDAATAAYLHSHGSPLLAIPARPIIEPALMATGNRGPIEAELGEVAKAMLDANKTLAVTHLKRAGMLGQNAVRGWFRDARNGWAPNAPATIRRKGSDRPLINTGALRQAMTYVTDTGGGTVS